VICNKIQNREFVANQFEIIIGNTLIWNYSVYPSLLDYVNRL